MTDNAAAVGVSGQEFPALKLAEFDAATRLFPDSQLAEIYSLQAAAVVESSDIPGNCNALVANLLLFQTDRRLRDHLDQPAVVQDQFRNAGALLKSGSSLFNGVAAVVAQNFVPSLVTMKTIFERCQIDSEPITINID